MIPGHSPAHLPVRVRVDVCFAPDGRIIPKSLMWEDGHVYTIDAVTDVRPQGTLSPGAPGDRYTVLINGRQSYLYFRRIRERASHRIGIWYAEHRPSQW